jgi:site-specific DNA-adenine methylase
MNRWVEPCVGSGAVLQAMLRSPHTTVTANIFASDINPYVIGWHANVKHRPHMLITTIKAMCKTTLPSTEASSTSTSTQTNS